MLFKMSITFLTQKQFRTLYGERIYAIARNIEKLYQKIMKLNEHIHFLKSCKQNNVIPNGLVLKHTTGTYRNKQLLENTMIKMRNNLLDHQFKQQRKVNIELNTHLPIIEWYLEDAVPF